MINPDQIPDEVVEAAAKAGHNAWRHQCAAVAKEEVSNWLEWEELEDYEREDWRIEIRAAIAAALGAWEGGCIGEGECGWHRYIELPLPTEVSDD